MKRPAPPLRSRQVRIWLDKASNPIAWQLEWFEEFQQVGYLQGSIAPFSSEGEVLLALASMPASTRAKDLEGTFLDDGEIRWPAGKRHKYHLSGWGYEQFQLELEV